MARWLVTVPFRALALATVRSYPKVLVLEFAAGPKGDIQRTAGAAPPLISVVTAVGPAHLEGFGTIDRIVAEKSTLVRFVPPEGLVVLGAENAHASGMDRLARGRVVKVPGRGRQLSENAARAVCAFLNIPADITERALAERPVVHGRLHEIDLNHFTVIDDSYNANPLSMELGLESLAQRPPRRVAILGDMKELGPDSARYHQEIGRFARPRCELLVGVGPLARDYNPDEWFATSEECIAALERLIEPGDCVLLKGSHSIRLGEVLHGLKVLARTNRAA
jgi:UDP-N-acetylmuramoyl-tripeptide--D-alanyl-D-alanine ligase